MRPNGYYWVSYCGHWTVARYDSGWWFLPGFPSRYSDGAFEMIFEIKVKSPVDIIRAVAASYKIPSHRVFNPSGNNERFVRRNAIVKLKENFPNLSQIDIAEMFAIDVKLVRRAIAEGEKTFKESFAHKNNYKPLNIVEADAFVVAFCQKNNITVDNLKQKTRHIETVNLKHDAVLEALERFPKASLSAIGRLFDLHHTTIMAVRDGKGM